MRLHFLGANRQVTGSRYCLEIGGAKVMIDCGLFQEREFAYRNWKPSPIAAEDIDTLLLTHAHLDHVGLAPKLAREGFRGPVLATPPTLDLAEIIMRDSARIQVEDARYKRRRHQKEGRRGKFPEEPLYTERDVERILPAMKPVPYGQPVRIAPGATATFHDAGHILGSALIEVIVERPSQPLRIVFSGDIGQLGKAIIRDPVTLRAADYVILESTYGDRDHPAADDLESRLAAIASRTLQAGGALVIPTFAVERAQELMYHLSALVHADRIPDAPIYLDSPMAVDATEVFKQHRAVYDKETLDLIAAGQAPLRFPSLSMTRSVQESKEINRVRGPKIIMSTSGMCTAGRIKHHLRQHIDDPKATILFVGYHAHGTLGRQILEGKTPVRIHGRQHRVRAKVESLTGLSGHADRGGLLDWLGAFERKPQRVFLTHGEEHAARALEREILRRHDCEVSIPAYESTVVL